MSAIGEPTRDSVVQLIDVCLSRGCIHLRDELCHKQDSVGPLLEDLITERLKVGNGSGVRLALLDGVVGTCVKQDDIRLEIADSRCCASDLRYSPANMTLVVRVGHITVLQATNEVERRDASRFEGGVEWTSVTITSRVVVTPGDRIAKWEETDLRP